MNNTDSLFQISNINIIGPSTAARLTKKDKDVLSVIDDLRAKKEWPKKRDRLKQFVDVKGLHTLRMYTSVAVRHEKQLIKNKSKEGRKKCVMCFKKR